MSRPHRLSGHRDLAVGLPKDQLDQLHRHPLHRCPRSATASAHGHACGYPPAWQLCRSRAHPRRQRVPLAPLQPFPLNRRARSGRCRRSCGCPRRSARDGYDRPWCSLAGTDEERLASVIAGVPPRACQGRTISLSQAMNQRQTGTWVVQKSCSGSATMQSTTSASKPRLAVVLLVSVHVAICLPYT